ncbi:UNVERIFIED_CONTAM: DNA replication protein psf1 [Siphonaria sp. JEL0065]|nr:DNA replication protein psf1 [Siphonaria sp. JEL0065]
MSTSYYADEALKLIREAKRANESGVFVAYNDNVVRNVKLELKHLYEAIKSLMSQRENVFRQMAQLREENPDEMMLDEDDDNNTLAQSQSQTQVALDKLSQTSTGFTVAAQMNHQAMHRNKRLLLVYHRSRMDAIRDMVWDLGGGAASALAEEGGMQLQSHEMDDDEDGGINNDGNNKQQQQHHHHQANASGLPNSVVRAMSPNEIEFLANYRQLLEDYRGSMLDIDLSAPLIPPKDLYVDVRVVKELGEIVAESGTVLKLMKGEQHYVRRSDVEKFITLGYLVQV